MKNTINQMITKDKSEFSINLKKNSLEFRNNNSNKYVALSEENKSKKESKDHKKDKKSIKNKINPADAKKLLNII